jgi:hypothetical protein
VVGYRIVQYKTEMFEMWGTANGEYALESQLEKIKAGWKEIGLEMKQEKSGRR